LATLSALSPQSGFTGNEVRRGLAPGDSRPGPGGLCSMHPPPSHSDLDADANYTALTPRPRLSPSFQCSPDCFGGSIAVCPMARLTRARRLPDGSLVSFRWIVRRVPDGCPTARSYRFGVSFDACSAAARQLARIVSVYRSTRARRLPDGSLVQRVPGGCPTARSYRFGISLDACPAAARWLARSTRARRLPDGSLVSLRCFV
jgi:hypothetical protein